MATSVIQARSKIASAIGTDIAYFTPPDEKRFIGEALMVAAAGAFLYAFVVTFAKKVGDKFGNVAGDYIASKIDEARGVDKPSQDKLLGEVRRTN